MDCKLLCKQPANHNAYIPDYVAMVSVESTVQKEGVKRKRTSNRAKTRGFSSIAQSHYQSQPQILCLPLPYVLVAGVPLSSDDTGPLYVEAAEKWPLPTDIYPVQLLFLCTIVRLWLVE